jgi:membrane-associated phospholipid phosphatase
MPRTPTDRVVALYLAATAALVLVFRGSLPPWPILVSAHVLAIVAVASLRLLPERLPAVPRFFRDWYPAIAFPIFYKEVELLARAFGDWRLSESIQVLEASLFGGHPSLFLSERFVWVPLSEYLHFCYLSFLLWFPLVGGLWYFRGKRPGFEELLFLVSVTFSVSYLFYILFPVDSPFYLAEPLAPPLAGNVFYEIVHAVSSRGGARGGAFPSSHVSISTVILFVTLRHDRRLFLALVPFYAGLVIATVYGRFHYALDVFAGWALALAVVGLYGTAARTRQPSANGKRTRG